jgi:anaerobic glycerol-3-phosphate dehydrogenase
MFNNLEELQNSIVQDLTVELHNDPMFDADLLAVKVRLAVSEFMQRRNYVDAGYLADNSLAQKKLMTDLENYYSVMVNLARYDYNMIGAEGEESHAENGVTRKFASRDSILRGVHAFCKVM